MNPEQNPKNARTESDLDVWNASRRQLKVTKQDGTECRVTIRKLPLREMQNLLTTFGDIEAKAALYLDSSDAPALSELSDEAVLEVVERGGEINDPLFGKWVLIFRKDLKRLGLDLKSVVLEGLANPDIDSLTSSPG